MHASIAWRFLFSIVRPLLSAMKSGAVLNGLIIGNNVPITRIRY